jgi:hypothetical protein
MKKIEKILSLLPILIIGTFIYLSLHIKDLNSQIYLTTISIIIYLFITLDEIDTQKTFKNENLKIFLFNTGYLITFISIFYFISNPVLIIFLSFSLITNCLYIKTHTGAVVIVGTMITIISSLITFFIAISQ